MELGSFDEAIKDFTVALKESIPGLRMPSTYFNRAKAFASIYEFQKANLDIRRAVKLEPENGEFLQLQIDIKNKLQKREI